MPDEASGFVCKTQIVQTSGYTVKALDESTWPAFAALVEFNNGIFGGCWCIWFHPDGPERGQGAEANRALKMAYVEGSTGMESRLTPQRWEGPRRAPGR